ncbi:Transposase-associated domain [Dillenia turbinata]|uniref:Transposase-associated domain n=1 Tax=Dillenia turbinata TaxID=194707 RepID=A0AAN8U7D1_9MAGN
MINDTIVVMFSDSLKVMKRNERWPLKLNINIMMAIDKSWMNLPKRSLGYKKGVDDFMEYLSNLGLGDEIRCPCFRCRNVLYSNPDSIKEHLLKNGIMREYTQWYHHGEKFAGMAQPVVVQPETEDVAQRQTAEGDANVNDGDQSALEAVANDMIDGFRRIQEEAMTESKRPNTRKRKLLAQKSPYDSVHKDVRAVPGSCGQRATQPCSSPIVATNLIQNHVEEDEQEVDEIIRSLRQKIDASQRIQIQELGAMGSTGSTSGERRQLPQTARSDFIHKDTGNIIGSCEKQPVQHCSPAAMALNLIRSHLEEEVQQKEEQRKQEFARQKREEDLRKQGEWCHRLEETVNKSSEELSALNAKLDFLIGAFEKIKRKRHENEQRKHEEEQQRHVEELRRHEEGRRRLEEIVQKNCEELATLKEKMNFLLGDIDKMNW